MSNRLLSNNDALDARHAITTEIRERMRVLPASPFDWNVFDPAAVLQDNSGAVDLRLVTLGQMLCTAPARAAELRAMWKECVVTAAFALQVAPRLGGDPNTSAIAGLLHRLGDMLTIRAIGEIEHAAHVRLDAASKADLCAAHGGELLERTVRAWNIPARAAATAAEWRRLREFPGAAADAAAVYLARLFAIELIAPQFCAPGVVECAIEEMGLDCASLAGIRSDAATENAGQGPASVMQRVALLTCF